MLRQLAPPAVANAQQGSRRHAGADRRAGEGERHASRSSCEPWDWDFYAEQVRKAKYAYDESQVRPYFEMDRVLRRRRAVRRAASCTASRFKERKDLPTYQEDVRVFEVFNTDGSQLGLFLVDWYARSNKRGGAWMNSFVEQSRLLGTKPVVVNNLNIPKPPEGQPTLLTFDEVNTAFHEFGHALHGLFSNVQYPQFSGTNVPRDFVEYPSQYNEMWATEPRVLANYAKHYQTGAPMPQALMDKVLAARKFNQGYATTEYLAAAMLDQAWHQLPAGKTPAQADVDDVRSRRRSRAPASTSTPFRRAIARRISRTCSRARSAIRPATTPISGARCWRAIPSTGSTATAGSSARTATCCARRFCRRASASMH